MKFTKTINLIQLSVLSFSLFCSSIIPLTSVSADDSTNKAMAKIEKASGEKNNLMNSSFATAARNAALEKGGVLDYNSQTQTLITYSILSNAFGDNTNYKSVYKTGKTASNSLKSALPDYTLPKIGTDTFISSLTSGSKEGTANKNVSKADNIATSSHDTDMSPEEMKKWKDKDEIYSLSYSVGEKLADNLISASSVSDKRNPSIMVDFKANNSNVNITADPASWWNAVLGVGSSVKDTVSASAQMFKKDDDQTYNGQWYGMYGNSKMGSFSLSSKKFTSLLSPFTGSLTNVTSSANDNTLINNLKGESSYAKSNRENLAASYGALVNNYITSKNNYSKINSKADLTKLINTWTAKNAAGLNLSTDKNKTDSYFNNSSLYGSNLAGSQSTKSDNGDTSDTLNITTSTFINFPIGNKKMNVGTAKSEAKSQSAMFLPYVVDKAISSGDSFGTWGNNYKAYINANINYSVTDAQWKKFESFKSQDTKQTAAAASSTSGNSVLSWSPILPYSTKWKNNSNDSTSKSQGKINSKYNMVNGFLAYSSDSTYVPLTGNILMQNDSNDKSIFNSAGNDLKLSIGGSADALISTNSDTSSLSAYTNNSSTNRPSIKVADSFTSSGKVSNNHIYGYDSYGNIIDGQDLQVIVPYWQNLTSSDLNHSQEYMSSAFMNSGNVKKWTINSVTGEGSVSPSDIKKFVGSNSPKTIDMATKVADKLSSSSSSTSSAKFVQTVNEAVGEKGGSKLSDKGAAALAVVISAGNSGNVQKFNRTLVNGGQKSGQLYLGETIKKQTSKSSNKDSELYTASDAIQRFGLMTDFGAFDMVRKTIVSAVANAYNSSFLQETTQNVFYTPLFDESNIFSRLGITVYIIAISLLSIILIITLFQYWYGKVKLMAFVSRTLKFILFFLILGTISPIEDAVLNTPAQMMANTPLKQQSILDQWSKLKQQQNISNVFYSSLMGDKEGNVNRSTSYAITFYTSTKTDGSIDSTYSDPNSKNASVNTTTSTAQSALATKKQQSVGNGYISPLKKYQYKKVTVTALDLISWASHMRRQELTATNANFAKSANREEPADGYKAGKEPLFDWLANNYQPIGSDNQSSSSSTDSSSDVTGSGSGSGSGGSGSSLYGKKRNPADTSMKSAYNSQNTNAIDNSKMYKGLDKYSEFAVQTKHTASDADKKYKTDVDSVGGKITASQVFLQIWSQQFNNSNGNGNPGDANSFLSLMNFAEAMNGNMNGNTTASDVGKNGVTNSTVGQVGRNDLINEISMTGKQKKLLNGNQTYSTAAKQMIDSYHIPAGNTDYFNLEANDSVISLMKPYLKNSAKSRDGYIYDINKKVLNDYTSIYSVVRSSVNQTTVNSNSSDDSGNNQTGANSVDSYSEAEAQIVALDLFFTVNEKLHYSAFPTGYRPQSISLDSWNRMLYIPIGEMKTLVDNSQYNDDSTTEQSAIALQDNVAEYLGLRSSVFSLVLFMIANYMLLGFSILASLFFKFVFPIAIAYTFFKNFIFASLSKEQSGFRGLLVGSIGALLMFSGMKLAIVAVFSVLSRTMNNSYAANGGYTSTPVLSHSIAIILVVGLAFIVLFKGYLPMLKSNFATLGAGNQRAGLGSFFGKAISPAFKRNSKPSISKRWGSSLISGIRDPKQAAQKLKNSIAGHVQSIRGKLGRGRNGLFNVISRKLFDKQLQSENSKGNPYYNSGDDTLQGRVNDILNSKYGGIDETISGGIDPYDLSDVKSGSHLGKVISGKAGINLGDPDTANSVKSALMKRLGVDELGLEKQGISFNGSKMLLNNINNKMLETPNGRKEMLSNIISNVANEVKDNSQGSGAIKNFRMPITGIKQLSNGELSLGVNPVTGIDPKQLEGLISSEDFKKNFKVLSTPTTDANGNFALGDLKVQRLGNAGAGALEAMVGNYLSNNFRGYNSGVSVGKASEAMVNQMLAPGMVRSGGQVFYNSSDPKQLAAASSISKKLVDLNSNYSNKLTNFLNGATSYVKNGDGHGLGGVNVIPDSNSGNAHRFYTGNAHIAKNGFAGLKNISRIPGGRPMDILNAQNKFENGLMNSYGSPSAIGSAYADAIRSSKMRISKNTENAFNNLQKLQSSIGPGGYANASTDTKKRMNSALSSLNQSLANDGQLNTLQNFISSGRQIDGARELSGLRENLMKASGVTPSIFNNMTVGQIGEASARAGQVGNASIDDNGIFTGTLKTDNENTVNGLSNVFKLLNL